jgi:hypothetical protein
VIVHCVNIQFRTFVESDRKGEKYDDVIDVIDDNGSVSRFGKKIIEVRFAWASESLQPESVH